jgi:hypothetical protein
MFSLDKAVAVLRIVLLCDKARGGLTRPVADNLPRIAKPGQFFVKPSSMINLSRKLLPRYPRTPVTTLTITAPPCPSPSIGCVGLP